MRRFVPSTPLGQAPVVRRSALLAAAERRHASEVRVFGSVARGEDGPGSDVDLLVTMQPGARQLDVLGLECDAEQILGVSVHVGTAESLRDHVRVEVLAAAAAL